MPLQQRMISRPFFLLLLVMAMYFLNTRTAWADPIGANDQRVSDMGGLGTASIHIADDPAIAYDSINQRYLAVWGGTESDSSSAPMRIYGQLIDALSGAEFGTNDFLIAGVPNASNANQDAFSPVVSYNQARTEYLVVYVGDLYSTSATETDVFGQRVDADGTLIGSPFPISDCGIAGDPLADVGAAFGHTLDLAYSATSDQYLVVWRCDDVGDNGIVNGEFEIIGRIVNGDGSLAGSGDFQISQVEGANGVNPDYDAESPAVTWNSNLDQYLVVWSADNATLLNGEREIFGRIVLPAGSTSGSELQISSTQHAGTNDSTIADVAYNSSTLEYLVVWEGDIITDDLAQIFGQRVNNNGATKTGSSFQISSNGTASDPVKEPSLIFNDVEQEYLVIWEAATATATEREIFGQRLNGTGGEVGINDFRISDLGPNGDTAYTTNGTTGLAYAGGTLNSMYAVWSGTDNRNGQITGENEIFGQSIEPVLRLQKRLTSVSTAVDAGDTVSYTLQISHTQTIEGGTLYDGSLGHAYNLKITDTLPSGLTNLTLVSASKSDGATTTNVASAFAVNGNTLTISGDLDLLRLTNGANHQVLTLVLQAKAANSIAPADVINNQAQLTWQNVNATSPIHPDYDIISAASAITVPASFAVLKASNVSTAPIGAVATYQLTVTVLEGTTHNLRFVDSLPSGLSYIASSAQVANANGMTVNGISAVSVGNALTITISSVINPGDLDNASVIDSDAFVLSYQVRVNNLAGNQNGTTLLNTVNASADNVIADNGNQATFTVVEPNVIGTKQPDDTTVGFGQIITYTVVITNNGTATAHDIVISDTLPTGLSFVANSASLPGAQVDESAAPTIHFMIPVLAVNASASFTYQAIIAGPPTNQNNSILTNHQTLSWTSLAGNDANERSGAGGVDDYRATTNASVTVAVPDMTIGKSDGGGNAIPATVLAYTLSYTNSGNALANAVVITESVPANTIFAAGASTPGWSCVNGAPANSTCSLAIASLNGGGSGTVTFAVSVTTPALAGVTLLTNTTAIGMNEIDGTPADNIVTDTTPLIAAPDLSLTKSDAGVRAGSGDTITYTLTYTNSGNQNATGVVITETVPANTRYVGSGWNCSPDSNAGSLCTLAIGNLNGDGGSGTLSFAVQVTDSLPVTLTLITNTASIGDDGSNGSDITANNSSTDTTPLDAIADLELLKTAAPNPVWIGDILTYQLTVTNHGPDAAPSVVVTDTLPLTVTYLSDSCGVGANTPPWVWHVGALGVNGQASCTISATVTGDRAAVIHNLATASSAASDPGPQAHSVDITTTVLPKLIINEVDYDQAGVDTGEFIELKNVGVTPINLSGLVVAGIDSGGSNYRTIVLPALTLAAGDYFVICGNTSHVLNCALTVTPATDWIEDSAPNAVALTYEAALLDVLSYEGDVVAPYREGNGVINGDDSSAVNQSLARSPDGVDSNANDSDWSLRCITPGASNAVTSSGCASTLQIDKWVTPANAKPGQPLTYTIHFTHLSNSLVRASGVMISDSMPTTVTVSNIISSGVALTPTGLAPDYVWQAADLMPGATGVVTITGLLNANLVTDTVIANSVYITGANATNAQASSIVTVTVPRLSLSATNYQVNENGGAAIMTATLDAANPYAAVSVNYHSGDDTANASSDYQAVSGVLTISPGQMMITLSVPISDDNLVEVDETLIFSLLNPTGAALINPTSATLTINNDDSTSLTIADVSQSEGDSGEHLFSFTLSLSNPVDKAVSVQVATADDSAISGLDFTAVTNETISFAAGGALTQTVAVSITGETIVEDDERFLLNLSNAQFNGASDPSRLTIGDASGAGNINNDDSTGLTIDDVTRNEGDNGETAYSFVLALSQPVATDVTVLVDTAAGTAQDSVDFADLTGHQVTFAAGAGLSQTVTVSVTGETLVEDDENFQVILSDPRYDGGTDATRVTIDDDTGEAIISNDDSATLSIDDVTWGEGDSGDTLLLFTLTLSTAVDKDVTVQVDSVENSATGGGVDFVDVVGEIVTFATGAALTQTVVVSVTPEMLVEMDEDFQLELSDALYDGTSDPVRLTILAATGIGVISNDDTTQLTVSDVTQSEGDSGTTALTFTLARSNPVASDIGVQVDTVEGSASGATDFTPISGELVTFSAGGGMTQSVTVLVTGETWVELDEDFSLTLSAATFDGIVDASRVIISDTSALGTIGNDDSAVITIDDGSQAEGDSGETLLNFVVTLSQPTQEAIYMQVDSLDGTALGGVDFKVLSGQVIIFSDSGALTQTVTLRLMGETLVEADEDFQVQLSAATYAGAPDASRVTIGDASGVGVINNDDSTAFTIDDVTASEGDSGETLFTFTLAHSQPADKEMTVQVTTSAGSATAGGVDFADLNGQVITFGARDNLTKTLTLSVTTEALVEGDESFAVHLANATYDGMTDATRVTIADAVGTGLILNDDAATLVIDDVTEAEGDHGTTIFTFSVTLSGTVDTGVAVDFATVADSADDLAGDFGTRSGTLNFVGQDGEVQHLVVNGNGDNLVEGDENFSVILGNVQASGRAVTIADGIGLGTISNDDNTEVSIDDVGVSEGNSGLSHALFTVTLSNPSATTVTVGYALNAGSATASSDFTDGTGTITFAPSVVSQTVDVPVIGDNLVETDESFTVVLTNPVGVSLADDTGVGTITNDDNTALRIGDVSVIEGNSGLTNALFVIALSNPSATTVTVGYALNAGSATASSDFTDGAGTITFAPSVVSQTLTVPVIGDNLVEADERFMVGLANPVGASLADDLGVGTITNDDSTALSIGDVTVSEGNSGLTNVPFTLTLSNPSAATVTVNYASSDGTIPGQAATLADADYSPSSGVIHFAPGQTSQGITLTVLGDVAGESNERFVVTLSNPVGASIADGIGDGTIVNDDQPLSFVFNKTVNISGISPECTARTSLQVPRNTPVVYCYTIRNTGSLSVSVHTLVDSHLGTLLNAFTFSLAPGASFSRTFTATLTVSTTNVATWTVAAPSLAVVGAGTQGGDSQPIPVQTTAAALVRVSGDNDDQDGDTIPDNVEAWQDVDGDNLANFLDPDADGDGQADRAEAGADPRQPTDSDKDGVPDYLDADPTALEGGEEPVEMTDRSYLPLVAR